MSTFLLKKYFFFNQKGMAPVLFLVAIFGLIAFTVIAVTANFKKAPYNSFFNKPASNANSMVKFVDSQGNQITQTVTPVVKVALDAPWPVEGQQSAEPSPFSPTNFENMRGSAVYLTDKKNFRVGEEVPVRVMVKAEQDLVNLVAVELFYNPDVLEMVRFDNAGSFISLWVEEGDRADPAGSNSRGVTLIGGVPTPGIQTSSSGELMTKVIFRAKGVGTADILPGNRPGLYRNSDNVNIYDTRVDPAVFDINISATGNATPSPTPILTSTPSPAPTGGTGWVCDLISANWLENDLSIEKRIVKLKVVGSIGCEGKQVSFSVKQSDPGGITHFAQRMPASSTFLNGVAQSAWVSEYVADIGGLADPPEYFFTATVVGTSKSINSADPKLEVLKFEIGDILKGDGNRDGEVDKTVDVSVLLTNYRKESDFPEEIDIIEDGRIDIQDFSGMIILLRAYNRLEETTSAILSKTNLVQKKERFGLIVKVLADNPFTQSVKLAEDSNFTQNVQDLTYDVSPKVITYIFSNAQPGIKTIYVRFTPSDGGTVVETSEAIELVDPNATSTPVASPASTLLPTQTPVPTTTTLSYKRIFVTGEDYSGSQIGGIVGANNKCQTHAEGAGLSGNWKAWLSTNTYSPASSASFNKSTNLPYYLVGGSVKIANNWADLVDGTLFAFINKTETGEAVGSDEIWSGTKSDGNLVDADDTCDSWSSDDLPGRWGETDNLGGRWSNSGRDGSCVFPKALYCFEQ